jgi:HD-GYP domain-containing protein (c-di-GMP phosphodiesterase class II)
LVIPRGRGYFENPLLNIRSLGSPPARHHPKGEERSVRGHKDLSGRSFFAGLLEALIQVMGTWNGYLYHHGPRVSCIALRIGKSFGLEEEDVAALFFGSVLADIGMIGMVEDAWENPTPVLSESARAQVNDHPRRSSDTVRAIPFLG